jgi:hypothetical protein
MCHVVVYAQGVEKGKEKGYNKDHNVEEDIELEEAMIFQVSVGIEGIGSRHSQRNEVNGPITSEIL